MTLRRLTLALLLIAAPVSAETLPGPIPATVVRVVDGDTIEVDARIWLGQTVRVLVRLSGIDTPEMKGKCDSERSLAQRAKEVVAGAVTERVLLLDVQPDKYGGRVVALVQTESGADISGMLIKAGLARPYGGGTKSGWCPTGAPAHR